MSATDYPTASMGGGRPLPNNDGSPAGPPYVGPNGLESGRPVQGGDVTFTPPAPRGQRLPSQRDEHGQAVALHGPFNRDARFVMPPASASKAATLGGPENAGF